MLTTIRRPPETLPELLENIPENVTENSAQWRGYALRRAAPDLWRVCDRTGVIIGHLAREPGTGRYEARRFRAAIRRFESLGSFWSADDALETLHHAR